MTLRLNGSTSGYVEIDAPATAGSNTLVLPNGNGTNGQYLQTNGSGGLSWATVSTSNLTRGTSQASTSGSAIDFTGIPSTARIITVAFQNVSKSGGDQLIVQLGTSSGPTTSGYDSGAGFTGSGSGLYERTDGFVIGGEADTAYEVIGIMHIFNLSGNLWVASHSTYNGQSWCSVGGGRVTLGDACDRVRIRPSGSNTFDGGSINIFYEV